MLQLGKSSLVDRLAWFKEVGVSVLSKERQAYCICVLGRLLHVAC